MIRQGLHNQHKNSAFLLGNRMTTKRALPSLLSAFVVASGAVNLAPAFTNHGATLNAQTPVRTTQTPATGTVLYVNPANGNDAAGAGTAEATPFKSHSSKLNLAQLFNWRREHTILKVAKPSQLTFDKESLSGGMTTQKVNQS
jgi:hypothetical protein